MRTLGYEPVRHFDALIQEARLGLWRRSRISPLMPPTEALAVWMSCSPSKTLASVMAEKQAQLDVAVAVVEHAPLHPP